jgi:hypothetical protein
MMGIPNIESKQMLSVEKAFEVFEIRKITIDNVSTNAIFTLFIQP